MSTGQSTPPSYPPQVDFNVTGTFKFAAKSPVVKDVTLPTVSLLNGNMSFQVTLAKLGDRASIDSVTVDEGQIRMQIPTNAKVKFLMLKLADVPANKGIAPILVKSGGKPDNKFQKTDEYRGTWSLEKDDSAAVYWVANAMNPRGPEVGLPPSESGLFDYYNPNSSVVTLDVYIGYVFATDPGVPPSSSSSATSVSSQTSPPPPAGYSPPPHPVQQKPKYGSSAQPHQYDPASDVE